MILTEEGKIPSLNFFTKLNANRAIDKINYQIKCFYVPLNCRHRSNSHPSLHLIGSLSGSQCPLFRRLAGLGSFPGISQRLPLYTDQWSCIQACYGPLQYTLYIQRSWLKKCLLCGFRSKNAQLGQNGIHRKRALNQGQFSEGFNANEPLSVLFRIPQRETALHF